MASENEHLNNLDVKIQQLRKSEVPQLFKVIQTKSNLEPKTIIHFKERVRNRKFFHQRRFWKAASEIYQTLYKYLATLNLGVHKVFNEKEADLSGIVDRKDSFVIDDVFQKTVVDVIEDGVEVGILMMIHFNLQLYPVVYAGRII
ncbi:Serpin domain containing protein [Asbolus verrucosus]|uniref:Serpin domain containing protein n=1 Tax=Asbolus verrucosus TaxID=1661398 RepID=A0A482VAL6_ASBVE|nr:Serpin domain containing protein [Asbolus verrucosus]